MAFAPGAIYANPINPDVLHGQVDFFEDGNRLDIHQSTDKAVIEWESFSIGLDEITAFQQLGQDSAVLNKVSGAQASALMGQLQANGKVFLITESSETSS